MALTKLWIPGRHLQWDEVLLNVIGTYGEVYRTYTFCIADIAKGRKRELPHVKDNFRDTSAKAE